MAEPRILLIVPTLGQRIDYLAETLASIRSQSVPADIVLVAPPQNPDLDRLVTDHQAAFLPDPGSLTGAINLGMSALKDSHDYVNWLNDDDRLTPGSLQATSSALDRDPGATVAFGACRYIDGGGSELWISRAGKWAPRVLGWGPDLIPQPGMLVRADAWKRVGGIDESFRFAFDLDLLLKLKALGPLIEVPQVVSEFRWHADSLTVGDRRTNIEESERAKRAALSPGARKVAWLWEPPVRWATYAAAAEVQRRARRAAAR